MKNQPANIQDQYLKDLQDRGETTTVTLTPIEVHFLEKLRTSIRLGFSEGRWTVTNGRIRRIGVEILSDPDLLAKLQPTKEASNESNGTGTVVVKDAERKAWDPF